MEPDEERLTEEDTMTQEDTESDRDDGDIPTQTPRRSLPPRQCTRTQKARYRDEESDESSHANAQQNEYSTTDMRRRKHSSARKEALLGDSTDSDEHDSDSSEPSTVRNRSRNSGTGCGADKFGADASGPRPVGKRNSSKNRSTKNSRSSDSDELVAGVRRKPTRKRQKISQSEESKSWQCPHCNKQFKVRLGYQYHMDKLVCRKYARPGDKIQRDKRKISLDILSGCPKVSGKNAERTCPICKRVFTSLLGINYHLEKRVCEKSVNIEATGPFPLLQPDSLFVTKYGVVQVIADDRATPTATLCDNYKQEKQKFAALRAHNESRLRSFQFNNTIKHAAKRSKLSKLYEAGKITQESVFSTSIGVCHPSIIRTFNLLPRFITPSTRSDPGEPEGSCPERIVECVMVPDARIRFRDDTDEELLDLRHKDFAGCKMFLQRRLLTSPYLEHVDLFCCSRCGQEFASKAGAKYHVQSEVCMLRSKNALDAQKTRRRLLSDAIEEIVIDSGSKSNPLSVSSSETINALPGVLAASHVFKRKKEKSVDYVSVYPQVYLALGFKLLPRSFVSVKKSRVSAFQPTMEDSMVEYTFGELEPMGGPMITLSNATAAAVPSTAASDSPEDPRIVLADLERQLRLESARNLGSVFPFVWKSLGFRSAEKPARRRKAAKRASTLSRRSMQGEIAAEQNLAIIDTSVLVEEIDSGRYPSLKRNEHYIEHETVCCICEKEDPPLLRCQFCTTSAHMACILTKVIVKEVDKDDFMCSKCISYVGHQRKRAEKRRLDKLNLSSDGEDADETELLVTTVEGREYESLVAQTRRVAELTELLDDAKSRLSQSLEANSLDEHRYLSIQSCERRVPLIQMAWDD